MRLPMSSLSNRSSVCFNNDMSSPNTYSIKLPYLGAILPGKSPLNLASFQKHLRELYFEFYLRNAHDERQMIITDYDLFVFEPDAADSKKRTFIYSNFESIVDLQILKFSIMTNEKEDRAMQAAFLPIGCEDEERFRSLYSTIHQTQYSLLTSATLTHPALLLFVIRKPGVGDSCSLFDCHVFAVHRELTAFELCDMIRKLMVKRTMSPMLSKRRTLVCRSDDAKEEDIENYQQTDNGSSSNVKLNDVVHPSLNPFSSSSIAMNNVQHLLSSSDTSKVLTLNSDIHPMSSPSKQRHFIKASTFIDDESDEIVNDLMNLVAVEKLKTQGSIKRHASFEQNLYSEEYSMNKKRYFHHKKRLLNPIPTINQVKIPPRIEGQLVRPEIVINRYGDIGNYIPKFLRDNTTMRSSDSNENIFFRSSNGQLINGFLQLDIFSTKSSAEYSSLTNDDHRVPHLSKSIGDILDGIQIHSSSSKPKRSASFTLTETQLPVDYRQYLRHTDQGAYLYGEAKDPQTTFEHSLGYFP